MNKNKIGIAVLLALFSGASMAANLSMSRNVEISGGVSGGADYLSLAGAGNDSIATHFDDFVVDLKTKEKDISLTLGLGRLAGKVVAPTAQTYQGSFATGVLYGWFDFTYNDIDFEVGRIATKVGYESAISYENDHITQGQVWSVQPTYYQGIRAKKKLKSGSEVYFDLANHNNNAAVEQLVALGIDGKADDIDYRLNYYAETNRYTIIDVVAELQMAKRKIGLNINAINASTPVAAGADTSATGIAAFTTVDYDGMKIPVRVEMLTSGTSGIYTGGKNMTTVTVTPTKQLGKQSYVRTEVTFATSEAKVFAAKNGTVANVQTGAAIQVGMLF